MAVMLRGASIRPLLSIEIDIHVEGAGSSQGNGRLGEIFNIVDLCFECVHGHIQIRTGGWLQEAQETKSTAVVIVNRSVLVANSHG